MFPFKVLIFPKEVRKKILIPKSFSVSGWLVEFMMYMFIFIYGAQIMQGDH